jgi:DNA-directed RNA polymerase subunit K/omega
MENTGNFSNTNYDLSNSMSNMENDLELVNREMNQGRTTEETTLGVGELKTPTYKKVVAQIAKVPKKTLPILTKFEIARIFGVRKQQLASGAKPCVDTRSCSSIDEIVLEEIKQRTLPFIIRRQLPNGINEYWKIEEFEIIDIHVA